MTLASILLKAPHIGVRQFKAHLSRLLKRRSPLIITERGVPVEVVIPYQEALKIVDIIDKTVDFETLRTVQKGKVAVKDGAKKTWRRHI